MVQSPAKIKGACRHLIKGVGRVCPLKPSQVSTVRQALLMAAAQVPRKCNKSQEKGGTEDSAFRL